MDQTILNSQYHDKDYSINNSLCSDHASDKPVTEEGHDDQNHALDITETETKEETSSDISGSDEDEQAVVDSKTATKDLVTDLNIGSYKVEDKRDPCDELLDELKKQKTHDLYCRSCTSNITQTVEIFPKGKEPFPYNKESFVLRFVIFVSFKYPYIYLPWFYNNTTVSPDHSSNGSDATPKKPVRDWLRLLFVLLLILLSAFVLWVPPSPSPPVPSPSPHTNGSSVPDPQKVPENGSNPHVPGGDTPTPHVPDGDTPTPHVPDGVEGDKPIPPSTKPRENRGGLIPLFRSIYFPSRRVLSVISLLLLAILALCWPSISWKRRTKRKNVVADKDLPNKTSIQNVEDHGSTNKPEDVAGGKKEPLGAKAKDNNKDGPSQNPGLITPENNKDGPSHNPGLTTPENNKDDASQNPGQTTPENNNDPGTETVISQPSLLAKLRLPTLAKLRLPMLPKLRLPTLPKLRLPTLPKLRLPTPAKLREILWKHIVFPFQNVLRTELDILKSIVYGGLIESITSFTVVSSAAASGTSAFNVLALGLANFFSGLFLIIYNLYGLIKSEPYYQSADIDNMTTSAKPIDPYKELLGKRNNVILHSVVVVLSFIIFAVIPPLFYGFSFKITDKGHYGEAVVVVAASLVCVISLSFGKAYAFKMNKRNTVAVYTGIAIGASVFSFIASQQARDLLEKYDFHKKF